jgi:hypothetical protein
LTVGAQWLADRGHRPSLLEIEQERARRATTLRTPALETSTRVLDVVSVRHALYLVTNATRGIERYTPAWFAAVRDLDGVTIKWP